MVIGASGDSTSSKQALADLCEIYWYPVYSFIRKSDKSPEDAEDITQSFFETILSKNEFAKADRDRGKFRTFLLTRLQGHMTDHYRRGTAAKRGGKHQVISFDLNIAEQRYEREPHHSLTAENIFDRRWASALLETVMLRLSADYETKGKQTLFNALESYISWNCAESPQQQVADRLGIGVAAVRMEVYHLRQRYRELLHRAIADTLSKPDEVEDELQNLRRIFS